MTTPAIKITFNEDTGFFTAEERGKGLYVSFGKTPEEAMARLEFAKTLWSDCELCKALDDEHEHDSPFYREDA